MKSSYEIQKAFWQKYTNDNLTNDDIDEICQNVRAFSQVLLNFHNELNNRNKNPEEPEERKLKCLNLKKIKKEKN